MKSNPSVPLHPVLIKFMAVGLSIHDDVHTFVEFARYVKENHDNKYTLSNGLDLYEEEPKNIELNDFIATSAVNALGRFKIDRANMVCSCLNIFFSSLFNNKKLSFINFRYFKE